MIYESYWGLRESPFRNTNDRTAFYESSTHEEALSRLQYLADCNYRVGLLVGPPGSGKTMLLNVFAEQVRRTGRPLADFSLLDVEPVEMLQFLAASWGLNPEPSMNTASLWRMLTDRLIEYRYQRLEPVVLLDDADQATEEVQRHIARLARFDTSPDARLSIVLSGRNEGIARLDSSLTSLAGLRIEVEPWRRTETEQFVNTRLSQAGRREPVFTPPAVDRMQEITHGIPRRVAQIAELSLLAGAGRNLQQIDAGVVESVYQELV